jgi:predicted transcriptional regulator
MGMNITKRISPFAEGIKFSSVPLLLTAFQQKAEAEEWTKDEIKQVIAEIKAHKNDIVAATAVVDGYTEHNFVDLDEDDGFDAFSGDDDVDDEDSRFKGDEDFETED